MLSHVFPFKRLTRFISSSSSRFYSSSSEVYDLSNNKLEKPLDYRRRFSVAFWIRYISKFSVTLVERDPTYSRSSSVLGSGFIHQQFSLPENIQMSLFGAEFIREIEHYLSVSGYENEGWFDSWLLLKALRAKAHSIGINYVVGELLSFETTDTLMQMGFPDRPRRSPVVGSIIRRAIVCQISLCSQINSFNHGNTTIDFAEIVNAAGPWSTDICNIIGAESYSLPFYLPIEKKRRFIFIISPSVLAGNASRVLPGLDTPMIADSSGIRIRRHELTGDFVVEADESALTADKINSYSETKFSAVNTQDMIGLVSLTILTYF
ncbi:unnamed protein product [Protopolystoma xenopodis]|uniref:FAD dependent oxidoreductase domain-containing protein n=1 Tax=Protopolystoma xenopodis TaxID=117903 RepID=A0A448XS13_9PLAT|nr:unnamed protein product [Protopolystoma xenopodis]